MLGVPVSQLKKIELDHQKDSDRCKLELLQYWLDNNLVPTWNEIVQALEKTDHWRTICCRQLLARKKVCCAGKVTQYPTVELQPGSNKIGIDSLDC